MLHAQQLTASQCVGTFLDSLHVRTLAHREPSQYLLDLVEQLRLAREEWKPGDDQVVVNLPGLGAFRVYPGRRHYEFTFSNDEVADIRIWRPEGWAGSLKARTGQFYTDFRSKWLAHHSHADVFRFLHETVHLFAGEVIAGQDPETKFKVARGDLAGDFALSRGLEYADLGRFVTRARKVEAFNALPPAEGASLDNKAPCNPGGTLEGSGEGEAAPPRPAEGGDFDWLDMEDRHDYDLHQADVSRTVALSRRLQTVYLGRFGSDQYARIYDKRAACEAQDKQWFYALWAANGWTGEAAVWRVEFSISGDALKEFKLMEPDEGYGEREVCCHDLRYFFRHLDRLWAYYTQRWLRHVELTHTRLEECDTASWWTTVQEARGLWDPAPREVPRPQPEVRRLLAAAKGYVTSIVAKLTRSGRDVGRNANLLLADLHEFVHTPDGLDAIQRKRHLYGCDDTTESAWYRSQRMVVGAGS